MTNGNELIHSFNHTPDTEGNFNGLTKREYFAAMAMQGMAINCSSNLLIEIAASRAVSLADALINALNEKP